jgi:hypothetical protein
VIRMRGGETITRRVDKVKWSPHRTPTWADLCEKFHLMADPILGPPRANQAIDIIAGLQEESTLETLMTTLRARD